MIIILRMARHHSFKVKRFHIVKVIGWKKNAQLNELGTDDVGGNGATRDWES